MVAGGLPVPDKTSVKNTILAAPDMQQFIAEMAQERLEKDLPYFQMRLGIHTGPIIAGIVVEMKLQYDIWGDTVNTASRLESHSEAGGVYISESTITLVKDEPFFRFEYRGKVMVKGKGELEMYLVTKA